ncbi:MAG: GTP-binding protein, partial [Myxococcota bacterium]|nr:GTP-binding protein [Myxococcota bacterium]
RDGAVLDREASLESLVMAVGIDDLDQNRSPRALVERIELATVVLLDGPGAGTDERARAAGIVGALNPDARITWTDTVPDALAVGQAAGDPRFDPDAARQRGALGDVLRGADRRSASGVSQFVFSARRPFHPTRLRDWLGSCPAGILRARGTYWVASQPDVAATLDVAMGDVAIQVQGTWWAAVPAAQHPAGPEWEAYRARVWHPTFGDRRQHITLITSDLDETVMRTALQDCLVTEAEIGQWGARAASPGSPPSTGAESR